MSKISIYGHRVDLELLYNFLYNKKRIWNLNSFLAVGSVYVANLG